MCWAATCDHRESENGGYHESIGVKGKGLGENRGGSWLGNHGSWLRENWWISAKQFVVQRYLRLENACSQRV